MRPLLTLLAVIALATGLFVGLIVLVSESGEVVTLRTRSDEDEEHRTRIRIVALSGDASRRVVMRLDPLAPQGARRAGEES